MRGGQAGPAVELEVDVGQVGIGGVRLDPGERRRLGLALHVPHRRQVDAGVGVEGAAGLELELDLLRGDAEPAQPLRQGPADGLGVGVHRRRVGRGLGALGQQSPERVARGRDAAAEVELARGPPSPLVAQPRQHLGERVDRGAPHRRVGGVASQVEMDPGDVEVGVGNRGLLDRQQVLAGDARLVALHRLAHRHSLRRHLGGVVLAHQVGAEAEADVGPAAEARRGRRAVRSSSATESSVIRTPALIARSSSASPFIGPFSEILAGSVPVRSAASSSPSPNTSQPVPASVRMRRRASEEFALIEGSSRKAPGQRARTHPRSAVRCGGADPPTSRRAACRSARPAPRPSTPRRRGRRRGWSGTRRAARPRRSSQTPHAFISLSSAASTASAAARSPVSGANWKPWPLQAEATTTRSCRWRMKRSSGVFVYRQASTSVRPVVRPG